MAGSREGENEAAICEDNSGSAIMIPCRPLKGETELELWPKLGDRLQELGNGESWLAVCGCRIARQVPCSDDLTLFPLIQKTADGAASR